MVLFAVFGVMVGVLALYAVFVFLKEMRSESKDRKQVDETPLRMGDVGNVEERRKADREIANKIPDQIGGLSDGEKARIEQDVDLSFELKKLSEKFGRLEGLFNEKSREAEKLKTALELEQGAKKEFEKVRTILEQELTELRQKTKEYKAALEIKQTECEQQQLAADQLKDRISVLEKEAKRSEERKGDAPDKIVLDVVGDKDKEDQDEEAQVGDNAEADYVEQIVEKEHNSEDTPDFLKKIQSEQIRSFNKAEFSANSESGRLEEPNGNDNQRTEINKEKQQDEDKKGYGDIEAAINDLDWLLNSDLTPEPEPESEPESKSEQSTSDNIKNDEKNSPDSPKDSSK